MTLARLKRELEQCGVRHYGETRPHGEKMLNVDWMTEVAQDPGFQQLLLPIGKGEWLLVKHP